MNAAHVSNRNSDFCNFALALTFPHIYTNTINICKKKKKKQNYGIEGNKIHKSRQVLYRIQFFVLFNE